MGLVSVITKLFLVLIIMQFLGKSFESFVILSLTGRKKQKTLQYFQQWHYTQNIFKVGCLLHTSHVEINTSHQSICSGYRPKLVLVSIAEWVEALVLKNSYCGFEFHLVSTFISMCLPGWTPVLTILLWPRLWSTPLTCFNIEGLIIGVGFNVL